MGRFACIFPLWIILHPIIVQGFFEKENIKEVLLDCVDESQTQGEDFCSSWPKLLLQGPIKS